MIHSLNQFPIYYPNYNEMPNKTNQNTLTQATYQADNHLQNGSNDSSHSLANQIHLTDQNLLNQSQEIEALKSEIQALKNP